MTHSTGVASFLVLAAVVCGAGGPGRAQEGPPGGIHSLKDISEQLRGTANRVLHTIRLPVPARADASATFFVDFVDSFASMRGGSGVISVVVGGKNVRVPAKRASFRRFRVRADERQLQRWSIDGMDVLVQVRPGAKIAFIADACAVWRLVWMSPPGSLMTSGKLKCVGADAACPAGFEESPESCGKGDRGPKLCEESAIANVTAKDDAQPVKVVVQRETEDDDESIAVGQGARARVPILYTRCSRAIFRIGAHLTILAADLGERWDLEVSTDGLVEGTVAR